MPDLALHLAVNTMDRLAQRIEAEMGLAFRHEKRRDLQHALRRIAQSRGYEEAPCLEWLLCGPWDQEKSELCAQHLTIGETYFFREPRAFDLIRDYALGKMRDGDGTGRPLRIWSAGCCTGEEPYSIAMALRQALPERLLAGVQILATDINVRHLHLAQTGIYRQWSFRNRQAAAHMANFSELDGNRFRIKDNIRKLVRFAELNLAAPVFPSVATDTHAMDIIVCRNVLMYFSPSQAKKVVQRFWQCLVEGGWLIVNPSEASSELFEGFRAVYYPDAVHFQKAPPQARPLGDSVPPPCPSPPLAPARPARAKPAAASARGRQAPPAPQGEAALAARYHAQAQAAIEARDPAQAIQCLKRLVYLQPDFILAHYQLGVLQLAQEKLREAARQFATAGELLAALNEREIVPGSDGLPAAYLLESVRLYQDKVAS